MLEVHGNSGYRERNQNLCSIVEQIEVRDMTSVSKLTSSALGAES